jgi:predicted dehydrogenase
MAIRIVQVGMGGWGQSWAASVVSPNKDVETVAWVDMDEGTLQSAQERLNLPKQRCFLTLQSALENVDTDAVLVTASLPGHVPNTLEALNAGKHVLLEKPFAPTIGEAQQLVALAEQNKRVLMIGQNYRFFPAIRAAIDLVRKQELGPVGVVNIDFRRYSNTAPQDTNRHYHIWQPLLVDMSIHHFDMMRAVLGQEPRQVICKTWNPPWSRFVEPSTGVATVTFDGGAVVNYRGSWVSTGPQTNWGGEWNMECEGGEIIWTSRGELPDKVLVRPLGKSARAVKLPEVPLTDRSGCLNAFVQALQSGQEPESSGRDNLKTLALMLASVEAAATEQPVLIPAQTFSQAAD